MGQRVSGMYGGGGYESRCTSHCINIQCVSGLNIDVSASAGSADSFDRGCDSYGLCF